MPTFRRALAIAVLLPIASCSAGIAPVEVVYGGTEHVCRCECPAPLNAVTGDAGYEPKLAIVH